MRGQLQVRMVLFGIVVERLMFEENSLGISCVYWCCMIIFLTSRRSFYYNQETNHTSNESRIVPSLWIPVPRRPHHSFTEIFYFFFSQPRGSNQPACLFLAKRYSRRGNIRSRDIIIDILVEPNHGSFGSMILTILTFNVARKFGIFLGTRMNKISYQQPSERTTNGFTVQTEMSCVSFSTLPIWSCQRWGWSISKP